MGKAKPAGALSWLTRLLLLVLAVFAGAAPVFLYLGDEPIEWLLARVFPGNLDLNDAELLTTWRAMLALAAGLLLCLVLVCVVLVARKRAAESRRRRADAAPLAELKRALKSRDAGRIEAAALVVAQQRGAEVVPDLLRELDRAVDEPTRRRLAATLYQIGRAVTAEVSAPPRR